MALRKIEINIHSPLQVSDQDVLRVVRAAINNSIKYESDRTLNHHHYWHDLDKKVELQITFN